MKPEDFQSMRDVQAYGFELGNRPYWTRPTGTLALPTTVPYSGRIVVVSWGDLVSSDNPIVEAFYKGYKEGRAHFEKVAAERVASSQAHRRKFAHARSRTLRARGW